MCVGSSLFSCIIPCKILTPLNVGVNKRDKISRYISTCMPRTSQTHTVVMARNHAPVLPITPDALMTHLTLKNASGIIQRARGRLSSRNSCGLRHHKVPWGRPGYKLELPGNE